MSDGGNEDGGYAKLDLIVRLGGVPFGARAAIISFLHKKKRFQEAEFALHRFQFMQLRPQNGVDKNSVRLHVIGVYGGRGSPRSPNLT